MQEPPAAHKQDANWAIREMVFPQESTFETSPPWIVCRGSGRAAQTRLSGGTPLCSVETRRKKSLFFLTAASGFQGRCCFRRPLACWQQLPLLSDIIIYLFFYTLFVSFSQTTLISSCCASHCDAVCFFLPFCEQNSLSSPIHLFCQPMTSTSPWASLSSTTPIIDFYKMMKNDHGFKMVNFSQFPSVLPTLSSTSESYFSEKAVALVASAVDKKSVVLRFTAGC